MDRLKEWGGGGAWPKTHHVHNQTQRQTLSPVSNMYGKIEKEKMYRSASVTKTHTHHNPQIRQREKNHGLRITVVDNQVQPLVVIQMESEKNIHGGDLQNLITSHRH